MTVAELINLLEKVETTDAEVYLKDSSLCGNTCNGAIIEHDLSDDEVVVVLKSRS